MTRNKKIALATLPALALVVLGSSVASAHMRTPQELTEEQRTALEEARLLRKEGNKDEARDVLKSAGLHPRMLHRLGRGRGAEEMRSPRNQEHEAVRAAIEANDYAAFKRASVEALFAESVSEDTFALLVKAHALHEEGKHDEAFALIREVGFGESAERGSWRHQ